MINLMDYELVQLSDINGTVYDSGVIVKDFDPTNFTPPAEGDLLFLSSGDISINDNVDTLDLGADLNSIHFEYAELRVVTGKPAATVTVTGASFGLMLILKTATKLLHVFILRTLIMRILHFFSEEQTVLG